MDNLAAAVWSDPDTFATCLIALGLDRYGGNKADESPIHWTSDTWIAEIHDDTLVEIPQRNIDRLMGACSLLSQPDPFYTTAAGFTTIVSALSGTWFNTQMWHPPTVDELMWGLIESHLIDPPDDPKVGRFGPEVVRYVNMVVRKEGFRNLPHPFQMFGIPSDPYVWKDGSDMDYSSEPDVNAAVEEAASQREADLDLDVADRVNDLALRLSHLPVKGDVGSIATELYSYASKLQNAGAELPES